MACYAHGDMRGNHSGISVLLEQIFVLDGRSNFDDNMMFKGMLMVDWNMW